MRLGLLVLLGLAVCAAQTPENETDVYYPAPYSDQGENLSIQNCGNETAIENQWYFDVQNIRNQKRCITFIAISQRTILIEGYCRFNKSDTTDLRVYPGNCFRREIEEECIRHSVKVLDVIEIAITPDALYKLTIMITEKMPSEVITPICLFNRDNAMDSQLQRESTYFQWSPWPVRIFKLISAVTWTYFKSIFIDAFSTYLRTSKESIINEECTVARLNLKSKRKSIKTTYFR